MDKPLVYKFLLNYEQLITQLLGMTYAHPCSAKKYCTQKNSLVNTNGFLTIDQPVWEKDLKARAKMKENAPQRFIYCIHDMYLLQVLVYPLQNTSSSSLTCTCINCWRPVAIGEGGGRVALYEPSFMVQIANLYKISYMASVYNELYAL